MKRRQNMSNANVLFPVPVRQAVRVWHELKELTVSNSEGSWRKMAGMTH